MISLIIFSLSNSAWEEEDMVTSLVSTNKNSGSMRSVGASYYSYLTNVEK